MSYDNDGSGRNERSYGGGRGDFQESGDGVRDADSYYDQSQGL